MESEAMPPQAAASGDLPVTGELPEAARRGPISHAIFRVARLHRMLAGQLLREVGLHPAQELVMMQLWDRGRMRQTDLARHVNADAATMTRTIQRLEKAGFVRRVRSASDRRSVLVEPTAASQALRRQVEDLWSRLEDYSTGDLTDTERDATLAVLERLETNLALHTGDAEPPSPG
ncbi:MULTISPECIES: MarR family winged helix-turn-helix transcriptional regulator [unclassified Streptomyces]|uniref:MarR family winged helix-turn-helix transcriptional regulator n=1 Tax=unclassified Streptomyces TaxID=2593676 RepID=UPI002E77D9B1|nr:MULTISPECIES: MarR family transcriptional regulator [unclassified Streptomyces]MEE1764762.1 MarR family transcriptional regulator [Streptomyces sp. SP18BB07]MEE1837629.1 MarR family transcriptional regulator [Streptomyces sp. SP17KL33]